MSAEVWAWVWEVAHLLQPLMFNIDGEDYLNALYGLGGNPTLVRLHRPCPRVHSCSLHTTLLQAISSSSTAWSFGCSVWPSLCCSDLTRPSLRCASDGSKVSGGRGKALILTFGWDM